MPYPNEHAARMKDPDQFDRIRREEKGDKSFGPGIDAIWGIKGGKVELQALRFDSKKYSESEAKSWLKDHDMKPILFEPATGKNENFEILSLVFPKEKFNIVEAKSWIEINMFNIYEFKETEDNIIFYQKKEINDDQLVKSSLVELRDDVSAYISESTTTSDIATTNDNQGIMQRYQCDSEYYGMPCFTVQAQEFNNMAMARMRGQRYNIQDERVKNYMKMTNYSKPFAIEYNGNYVKIDGTTTFRR